MNSQLKLEVIIRTKNEEEKNRIGNKIHKQLKGNPDYINSNIILNIDVENEVWLGVFNECENIPVIII